MPLVSVVIPAYNAERFLAETLDHVLAQTLQDIEVIVVDDGSTDGTAVLVEGYERVSLVRKPNGGVSSARNLGVRQATGQWVAFVDADDLWHPRKLADQLKLALAYPQAVLGLTEFNMHNQACLVEPVSETKGLPPHRLQTDFGSVFQRPYLGMSGVFVRRDAFLSLGGFDESLPYAEDIDFYLRLLYGSPGYVLLAYHAVYVRPVEGSLSSDSASGYVQLLAVYQAFLLRHPDFQQAHPRLVQGAMAELHLKHARSLIWGAQPREALNVAWRSFGMRPSMGALAVVVRALTPAPVMRLLKKIKP